MSPQPHPNDRPVRILFVFAEMCGGDEEAEMRLLARTLDPARFRIDAFPCLRRSTPPEATQALPETLGIQVDATALDLSFDDTVSYLARKLSGHDIVISCQDVADIYPALERLRHRPPLIEYGTTVAQALSGPKHFTTRYVGAISSVTAAAATRMPDRPRHVLTIAPMQGTVGVPPTPTFIGEPTPSRGDSLLVTVIGDVAAFVASLGNTADGADRRAPKGDTFHSPVAAAQARELIARHWVALFDEVLAELPAPPPDLFRSFVQGGFEGSTHRLHTGRRIDVIAATGHDIHAESDYRQLGRMGLRTVRDAARWHLIETRPGHYDFSSFLPMARAARRAGSQVIWDLLHYGCPDHIDIWSPDFAPCFAAFAEATARALRETTDDVPFWCPVNEISFFSWAGGDARYLNPFAAGRGFELKVQLARASIAAMQALRAVDPRARFVQCEPLIAVHHDPATGRPRTEAEGWHQAQFQAFELLCGNMWPQIGGDPSLLDIVGVNYYTNNQWLHAGPAIDVDHSSYRPLSDLIFETYARYQRPIFVSETGVEDHRRAPWLRYVADEVFRARQRGVPVEGICLYPILNHPGWDDDRACQNGLLTETWAGGCRGVDPALFTAVTEVVAASPSVRCAPSVGVPARQAG